MRNKKQTIKFKRRVSGATNYKKRLKILLYGKPRIVIRKSLNNIFIQLVEYDPKGDKVISSAHSQELDKFGWKGPKGNIPSAYLTGLLFGQKAKKKGVKESILDMGLNSSTKGSRIYAALKGAIDSGIKVPVDTSILPEESRICGRHISDYSAKLAAEKAKHTRQFGAYAKKNIDLAKIPIQFNDVKKKISEA